MMWLICAFSLVLRHDLLEDNYDAQLMPFTCHDSPKPINALVTISRTNLISCFVQITSVDDLPQNGFEIKIFYCIIRIDCILPLTVQLWMHRRHHNMVRISEPQSTSSCPLPFCSYHVVTSMHLQSTFLTHKYRMQCRN